MRMNKNRMNRRAGHGRITAVCLVAVLAMVLAGLVSCGVSVEAGPDRIEVSGYIENFYVGDSFATGADLRVEAVYKDGTRQDVTAEAEIAQEKGMDMSVPGDYQITVSWGGKKCIYTVYVKDAPPALRELRLDTAGAKTSYQRGDVISLDGLKVTAVYQNEQGVMTEQVFDSLADFTITVQDPVGGEVSVKKALEELGTYTIRIAQGDVAVEYSITVEEILPTTMLKAVEAIKYAADKISGGELVITDTIAASLSTQYTYAFGPNYTYIATGGGERHYSLDETGKLVSVVLEGGSIIPDATSVAEAMDGVPIMLWWHEDTVYGIEAAIQNFYGRAVNNANGDLVESIDEATRTYSFSFGYVMERITGVDGDDYFFVNSVTFTLDENNALITATLSQEQYINYASRSDQPNYSVDANGHATLTAGAKFSSKIDITVTQTVGERTAVNPYGKDAMTVTGFELMYDGKPLGEDDVISGDAGMDITIRIVDIQPETADLTIDKLYYSDGVGKAESTIFVGTGFTVHRNSESPNIIRIRLSKGGDWELVLSTEKFTRWVKLSVTGAPPTSLTTEVYHAGFASFIKQGSVTPMVGASVYFRAMPDQYANDAYTVELVEGDAEGAEIIETEVNGVACRMFRATRAGRYEVLMTSKVAKTVTCRLVFEVVDIPDLGEMLTGTYHATDTEGGVYELVLAGEQTGETVSGSLTVRYTLDGAEKTQLLTYEASSSDLSLVLTEVSGEPLGISLKVNSEGKLVLEDRYGVIYPLSA